MDFLSPEIWPALLTLGVVAVMFALFISELYPPETVAIGGAGGLLAAGVLTIDDLLQAIANPAPLAIAAMFVISGALVRTGALGAATAALTRSVETRPRRTIAALGVFIIFASAFMNNTPVVLILIPVVSKVAARLEVSPSRLLIPLSYCAILGGVCTLIGASTNLLVDGVARSKGLAPFSLFEVTPLALILAAAGFGFMALAAPRFLPDRQAIASFLTRKREARFMTQIAVGEGSPLIGEKPLECDLFQREGMRIVDVLRGDASLRRNFASVAFEAGDIIVIRTGVDELLTLRRSRKVAMVDEIASSESVTVEALIGPDCAMVGRTLGRLRLRRRYGVYPLAVHRRAQRVGRKLDDVDVRVGDTLLLEGAPEDIRRLADDMDLVDLNEPSGRPFRRRRAPVVLLVLAAVVGASAFGGLSIAAAAVIGVAVVLLTRCIDADEAFSVIDGSLLALIFAMLAVGRALQVSGAADMIAEGLAPYLMDMPPWLALWCLYLVASAMTELVTNAAVAVVMTPVAISLAAALGVDARAFVVAVMLAASLSFATPIGYQTNTMVYAPGGYRFTDFLRLGLPMNLGLGLLAAMLIPLFWPL
ncbi:SLC13 family permease [Pikeienuella sp. HZG-20]|uniref:SLC13 family permease n=1 Tax=Paludibacillus litoralis TaxID=3133267 RepID=UPI0030EDDAA2